MITRWQAARGYPKTGFLNKLQHKALLTEIVATHARPVPATTPTISPARRARQSSGGGGGRRWRRGSRCAFIGGVVGGMMGGMFRH